ncbi:MAG: hypothetical protein V7739_12715 [Motiliproteus sp.]
MKNKRDYQLDSLCAQIDQHHREQLDFHVAEILNEGRTAASWCYDMLAFNCIPLEESTAYLRDIHDIRVEPHPDPDGLNICGVMVNAILGTDNAAKTDNVPPVTSEYHSNQAQIPAYRADARGVYPSFIAKIFIGIEKDELQRRRDAAFTVMSMYCEKHHPILKMNPIRVAIFRSSEISGEYLQHLKRKATPWERRVVQTFCLEQETHSPHHFREYVMPQGGGRCRSICLTTDDCKDLNL